MQYGVIGEKLSHSFSKEIHALLGDYEYVVKEIPQNEIQEFLQKRDFKGINVTIPYKKTVIPFLDFIDENAREIGAVNTIVNKNGKLYGYNTDFIGLKNQILSMNLDLTDKVVMILGTGGTSQTAQVVAKSLNAKKIIKVSRNNSKTNESVITYDEIKKFNNEVQILINTTPCGMFPKIDENPLSLENFSKIEGVVDVIYNPLKSKLVLEAQKKGIVAQGGLFMLVSQAVAANEIFFERKVELTKVNEIYKSILQKKQNIVLIGMPGAGKSTIGKKIAQSSEKEFFDTDQIITAEKGKTPAQIIEESGENAFREMESCVCRNLASKNGIVIATGGGVILREENIINLKHNGIVYFIDRDIKEIFPSKKRPLTDNAEKLQKVYNERYELYKKSSDVVVKVDKSIFYKDNLINENFCFCSER